jgi:hypothetical protein
MVNTQTNGERVPSDGVMTTEPSLRTVVAEKELIAKWNAGDYSAEGWVNK